MKKVEITVKIYTGGHEDYYITYDPLYDTDRYSADVKTGAAEWGARLVELLESRYPDAEVTYTVLVQQRFGNSVVYDVTPLDSDDADAIARAEAVELDLQDTDEIERLAGDN